MNIAAINEQLLRAISVGVALVEAETMRLLFHNSAFAYWFGTPEPETRLGDVIEGIGRDEIAAALSQQGRFAVELRIKPWRRTQVIALAILPAQAYGEVIWIAGCQNFTRIRELESMIDSYSTMVERNTRELEREKERVERLLLNLMPRSVHQEFRSFGPAVNLASRLQVLAELMSVVAPVSMTAELMDEFLIQDLGSQDVKGLGVQELISVTARPQTAQGRY